MFHCTALVIIVNYERLQVEIVEYMNLNACYTTLTVVDHKLYYVNFMQGIYMYVITVVCQAPLYNSILEEFVHCLLCIKYTLFYARNMGVKGCDNRFEDNLQ